MVVPGSHLDQDKLRSRYPGWSKHGRDYCVLINKDPLQGSEVLIPLQPGDILLWDSRLAHCGRVGSGDTSSELSRASLCVCMGPRSHASSQVLSRRRCALKEGWGFNHCPWEAAVKKRQDQSRVNYRTCNKPFSSTTRLCGRSSTLRTSIASSSSRRNDVSTKS